MDADIARSAIRPWTRQVSTKICCVSVKPETVSIDNCEHVVGGVLKVS